MKRIINVNKLTNYILIYFDLPNPRKRVPNERTRKIDLIL